MNVVVYARYSSHNQTEASIEGQLKVCYEYAKQNHITVIGEYVDRAMTGTFNSRAMVFNFLDISDISCCLAPWYFPDESINCK